MRRGRFDETAVALAKFLSDLGIPPIIPPLATKTGKLLGALDQFKTIMYPFVTEHNDYETNMSDPHWREFGAALRRIHTALAYFRYERIIQDIAAFCKQLLFTDEGGQDREQSLQYVESNFWPNSTIDIAYQSDLTRSDHQAQTAHFPQD